MIFDVNAETRPPRQFQPMLDRWAFLHFHSQPVRTHKACGCGSKPCHCHHTARNEIALNQALHRMETTPSRISQRTSVKIAQKVGEEAGEFRARCVLLTQRSDWPPSSSQQAPEAIDFDHLRSQWLALVDCVFDLGDGWEFRGSASGETCPMQVQGRELPMAFAAGILRGSTEKAAGLEGSFTLSGRLTAATGFIGSISCSIHDPRCLILKDREIPEMRCMTDPGPDTSYLVVKAVKSSYRPSELTSEESGTVRIRTDAELKTTDFRMIARGSAGLRSSGAYGHAIGSLDMETTLPAASNSIKSEGEASGRYEFKFTDIDGDDLGSVTAELTSGRAFPVRLYDAERQFTAGFCGAGRIRSATGHFEGAQGILSTHSALTLAPHVISDIHVLGFIDPGGRMRAGVRELRGAQREVARSGPPQPSPVSGTTRENYHS